MVLKTCPAIGSYITVKISMMRGVVQEGLPSNGEVQRAHVLEELARFDPALQDRIAQIEKGEAVNGHSPNGLLTKALNGEDWGSNRALIEEYRWLIAFEAFPFRTQEDKHRLMQAGIDALYDAGKRYDTGSTAEPNFLIHASNVISTYLQKVFGEPASQNIPTEIADSLLTPSVPQHNREEASVFEAVKPEPVLPNERTAEDLRKGQTVLVLWDNRLVESKVQEVVAYTHPFENKVAPIPKERLQALQEAFQQRRKTLLETHYPRNKPRTQRNAIPSGINSDGIEMTRSEFIHTQIMPDPELLRLAIAMQPAFSQFVPRKCPGFVRLSIPDEAGLIIDMNVNRIIPIDAWQRIKEDSDYRLKWYASATPEDQRHQDELTGAITQRIIDETIQPDLAREEDEVRRARTHSTTKGRMAFEAVSSYGS